MVMKVSPAPSKDHKVGGHQSQKWDEEIVMFYGEREEAAAAFVSVLWRGRKVTPSRLIKMHHDGCPWSGGLASYQDGDLHVHLGELIRRRRWEWAPRSHLWKGREQFLNSFRSPSTSIGSFPESQSCSLSSSPGKVNPAIQNNCNCLTFGSLN